MIHTQKRPETKNRVLKMKKKMKKKKKEKKEEKKEKE